MSRWYGVISVNSKSSFKIFVLLALLLSACVRFYWIPQKTGLHLDESLSVIISECKEVGGIKKFPENVVYTGAEMRRLAWASSPYFADALSDIKQLHVDNKDSPHTNLYYSVLRLCLIGTDGQLRTIIERGCYLNIFFLLFSFFFLYRLLKRLFSDDLVIASTILVAFVNTASISNTMFIRPYALQETFFILLTYVFTCIYQTIGNGFHEYRWAHAILLSVLLSFVLLSGYFSLIYVVLLLGTLMAFSLIKGQNKNVMLLSVSFALSLVLANIFYRKYFDGFLSDRALEGFNILSSKALIYNLFKSVTKAFEFIFAYLLLPFFIICLPFFRRRSLRIGQNEKIAFMIIICCTLYVIASLTIAPYKDLRYVVPAFSLLTLIIPIIFKEIIPNGTKKITTVLIALAYIFVAFNPLEQDGYLIKQRIKNLYRDSWKKFPFGTKPNIPVLIYISDKSWMVAEILAFVNNNQKYEFVYSYDSLMDRLRKHNHVFVCMENKKEAPIRIPEEYEVITRPNSNDNQLIVLYELKRLRENCDKNNGLR
jgi:hypothetical protein